MKKQLNYLWKGSLIGIGFVAPGTSGGGFAAILGLYETLINAAKDMFSHPLKILKELWGLLLGVVIGIAFSFVVIFAIIKFAPIPMTMLIVGFILGSTPKIYQETKVKKKVVWDYVAISIAIALTVILPLLPTQEATVHMNLVSIVILFAVGVVAAATLVIPGLSGSMVLMVLGFYFFFFNTIIDVVHALVNLELSTVLVTSYPLIPAFFGLVIGLFVLSKTMSHWLKTKRQRVYCVIFGAVISSPF
ncbi:MAG: DUF368 domain-containing protein, partial [Bacilli bacterium]